MKRNRLVLLALLMIASEVIFLLPFVVVRIFRPTFLEVFGINNFQLGSAFSLYGIIAMLAYIMGGPLADRYDPRKLIAISLLITAFGGLIMARIPSLLILTLLYGLWGVSTILLFWAASIKAIRQYGGEYTQGRAYGLVESGRGLIAALIASGSVLLLQLFLPAEVELATTHELSGALTGIIYTFIVLIVAVATLIWFIFPDSNTDSSHVMEKLTLSGLREAARRRTVWLQALIVLCAYVSYKSTDDFSLYASDVMGYNDVEAAGLATVSFWVRPFAALGAGILGDRLGHSRMTGAAFLLVCIGSAILASGWIRPDMGVVLLFTIVTTGAGIYGLRGLYFALFQESKVPLAVTGSAVGLISLIGYTPDVFMGPVMGHFLDSYPGQTGHQLVFAMVAGFALLGLLAAYLFKGGRV